MDVTSIGKQIAALRRERGIKQEELANHVGVTAQAVSKWENGGVPDVELLPRIADFFEISIDSLFGRSVTDYSDIHTALTNKIIATEPAKRFKEAFDICWTIERAMFGKLPQDSNIEGYEKELKPDEQQYSSIMSDNGFTRMGIANRLQYFLLVPDPRDTEAAYFKNIDYVGFFKDFSDKDVFDACVMFNKREHSKAFTPTLLVKKLGLTPEKAKSVLAILKKYRLIYNTQIEMDDEVQTVYHFSPTPSFAAMLIFAREMIQKPECFAYFSGGRNKPYFK